MHIIEGTVTNNPYRLLPTPNGVDLCLSYPVQQHEPPSRFRHAPNNDPIPRTIHNQRKNKGWHFGTIWGTPLLNPLLTPQFSPLSPKPLRTTSIRRILTMIQHSGLPQPMKMLPWKLVPPDLRIPVQHHLQALQPPLNLHQLPPPSAFINPQIRRGIQIQFPFVPGQIWKTKNWSISRITPNPVLHGNLLAQVCKLRWGILKQMSDQHGLAPPHEPEAED